MCSLTYVNYKLGTYNNRQVQKISRQTTIDYIYYIMYNQMVVDI